MSTSIRLSEEAKSRLDLYKREGESYDDVIIRLTSDDKWAGFGVASSDPKESREGMEAIRDRMRSRMDDHVEKLDR
ncbi:DUF217 family protein [Natronomonas pharaonis DSM 2160]|uniref:DUF217 family protein n=1 Tax=Natronomonas pharaonis (strain ATCC 35678 / DSM 2160 / CIP 103997 / JCM 8858 / NBRC 14720 / NCIMB 2260 / Gabara) TaxID=348780 RepID=A0A1U7EYT2_NATPD|nr:antitoxin VapB family protein [Natronomonas pharaonis]CAI50423.1 DUF217 family protein [Natronomonas pharaonis DSM 2160]